VKHGYVYIGVSVVIVIIGIFLIYHFNQNFATTNSMNVTDVIHNLDTLYDKPITVSGYWYDRYPRTHEIHCSTEYQQTDKLPYDDPAYNSQYAVYTIGGNNYLTNTTSGERSVLLITLPNNALLFNDVNHDGEFVTVSEFLKKSYTNDCGGSHYYKSAILQVNR
jgi:hypothetical protein